VVLVNDGDLDDLLRRVEAEWAQISTR
jgi:hypothetical protein